MLTLMTLYAALERVTCRPIPDRLLQGEHAR
jgi:hypothetical protein